MIAGPTVSGLLLATEYVLATMTPLVSVAVIVKSHEVFWSPVPTPVLTFSMRPADVFKVKPAGKDPPVMAQPIGAVAPAAVKVKE